MLTTFWNQYRKVNYICMLTTLQLLSLVMAPMHLLPVQCGNTALEYKYRAFTLTENDNTFPRLRGEGCQWKIYSICIFITKDGKNRNRDGYSILLLMIIYSKVSVV